MKSRRIFTSKDKTLIKLYETRELRGMINKNPAFLNKVLFQTIWIISQKSRVN